MLVKLKCLRCAIFLRKMLSFQESEATWLLMSPEMNSSYTEQDNLPHADDSFKVKKLPESVRNVYLTKKTCIQNLSYC